MDMPSDQADHLAATRPDMPEHAAARRGWERKIISDAEADIAAGNGIEWDALEAWLNDLDDNPDAPPPEPQRLPARS